MARNVEVKAKLRDRRKVLEAIKGITNDTGTVIKQTDTFFVVPRGRMKLRQIEGLHSELIYYCRPDAEGPKLSTYEKYESLEHSNLLSVLSKSLEVKGVVKKVRHLYVFEQTRIHLDEVEGLGEFLELEVVLKPNQSMSEGQLIAEDILHKLAVENSDLVAVAYLDLLLK